MKKHTVYVRVRLEIEVNEKKTSVGEVIEEMDYSFYAAKGGGAFISDHEIVDWDEESTCTTAGRITRLLEN